MAALKSLQWSPSSLSPLFSMELRIFDSAPFLWAWEEGTIQGLYYRKWHLFNVREYHWETAGGRHRSPCRILELLNWICPLTKFRKQKDLM